MATVSFLAPEADVVVLVGQVSGGGEDGSGRAGEVPVEGGNVSRGAGVILQTARGTSIGVPAGVLLDMDGPAAGGGGVQGVNVNVDVDTLVSHVQEHVLTRVGTTDN